MPRISVPWSHWLRAAGDPPPMLGAVVIGSGYGGSVAALRLAEQGWQVTVLERGSEFLPGDFPNDISTAPAFLGGRIPFSDKLIGVTGLYEIHTGRGVASLVANGVGGGSLINAGVLMRPDADVFEQKYWPAALRRPGVLNGWMDRAKQNLNVQSTERIRSERTRSFGELEQRINADYCRRITAVNVTIDLDACTGCGDCASGCNVEGAKQTLRHTYLSRATAGPFPQQDGQPPGEVRVLSNATVYDLWPSDTTKSRTSWRLRVLPTERIDERSSLREAADEFGTTVEATLVVLAAGTFGSTSLLQRASARRLPFFRVSPRLGKRFSGNGDSLSFSVNEPHQVNAVGIGADRWRVANYDDSGIGPTITRAIDARAPLERLTRRLVIEDGAAPGAIGRLYSMLLSVGYMASQLGRANWTKLLHAGDPMAVGHVLDRPDGAGETLAQRSQIFLTMGHDESAGEIRWRQAFDASEPFLENPANMQTYQFREKLLREACENRGTQWVPNVTWKPVPKVFRSLMDEAGLHSTITTVHPLGGCVMGDDPTRGVVDHIGRVWLPRREDRNDSVYESLYVLDGSILPTSLGCNPLLTITALAERAMQDQAGQAGRGRLATNRDQAAAARLPEQLPVPIWRERDRQQIPAYMEERLFNNGVPTLGTLRRRYGDTVAMDLQLKLHACDGDWAALWDDPAHRFDVEGEARFSSANGNQRFDVQGQATFFERDTSDSLLRRLGRMIALMVVISARSLRGGLRKSKRESKISKLQKILLVLQGFRYAWQAAEIRTMRYTLQLEAAAGADDLKLTGTKRITSAPKWGVLLRYLASMLKGDQESQLEPTFIEQATNLVANLNEAGDSTPVTGEMHLTMDYRDLVERLPLRLSGAGDLPTGLSLLAEYPLFLTRFVIKDRIFDLWGRDYSYIHYPDDAPPEETELRQVDGDTVHGVVVPLSVPVGRFTHDAPGKDRGSIQLQLRRYRPHVPEAERFQRSQWREHEIVKAKSVLLVHAFAQSGHSFTSKSVDKNPAERLYEAGYDVWILEHRLSTRLPAHELPSTMDQMAEHDIPGAVSKVIEHLEQEVPVDLRGRKIQIFLFAQCIGAATTSMALMKGGLSYPESSPAPDPSLPPQRLPKLAGYINSQTHPHVVGQPLTQAKTWLPAFLRDALKLPSIPFAVRGAEESAMYTLTDRLLAALPVPESELCPIHGLNEEGYFDEDDIATCRRLRFIEAPLFKHANINRATHRELPKLFGGANLALFAHAGKCVVAERLVTEDGDNDYVTDKNLHVHGGLPICYLHGGENELFHPESAVRSGRHYGRVHPEWSAFVQDGIRRTLQCHHRWTPADGTEAGWIVQDYGHVDVLIARDAAERVFTPIAGAFDWWLENAPEQQAEPKQPASTSAHMSPEELLVRTHFPMSGPFIGSVFREEDSVRVRVSFRIDDRFSDGKGSANEAGSRTWAFVRWHTEAGHHSPPVPMRIEQVMTPGKITVGIRMASAELPVPDDGRDIRFECLSVHEVLSDAQQKAPLCESTPSPNELNSPALNSLLDRIANRQEQALTGFADQRWPGSARTVSRLLLYPERSGCRFATLRAGSIRALTQEDNPEGVHFGIASCRYPGFRVEHRRVDRWLCPPHRQLGALDFALLLGDQIYADATGGFADDLNPVERYYQRYRYSFNRNREGVTEPSFGDFLSGLPVFMTPDDHEYWNSYPDGASIVDADPENETAVRAKFAEAARRSLWAYQFIQMENFRPAPAIPGVWQFDADPTRVMMLDSRSFRERSVNGQAPQILTPDQLNSLRGWLRQPEAADRLNVIATGSVVLPGLIDYASPLSPGIHDNFQKCARDRASIFTMVHEARQLHQQEDRHGFRVLFISGDYHTSAAFRIMAQQEVIGGCIVAPPLYSPTPIMDTSPAQFWRHEPIHGGRWHLVPAVGDENGIQRGNGLARLHVTRVDAHVRYRVDYSADLWLPHEQNPHHEWRPLNWRLEL